ncbi:hypothetical protein PMZ80_008748 [Knufia obscura]|uniref:Clr5 domain-containing protein n=1 Tax=Knufia obscura TaxID=1635080 RepID=A0ABR0RH51_9EURO|nr:hypothetical protein PMZ80_008748 [Knufia obscura]
MAEATAPSNDLSLVIYQQQRESSPTPSFLGDPGWSQCRADIERLYLGGQEKQQILRHLERKHDFKPTYHELKLMIKKWRLRKPLMARTRKPIMRSRLPDFDVSPISVFMPTSNLPPDHYLYQRSLQEAGIWLLGACTQLWHDMTTTSLEPPDPDDLSLVTILHHRFATPLSIGNGRKPSNNAAIGEVYIEVISGIIKFLRTRFDTPEEVVRVRPAVMAMLLAAFKEFLDDDTQLTHAHLQGLRSLNADYGFKYVTNQSTIAECYAKLDLLYVLRFRAAPIFGSVFQDSQRPPSAQHGQKDDRTSKHMSRISPKFYTAATRGY